MNRVKATLAGFAFLAVIVLLCAAATVAERSMAANAAVKEAEATTLQELLIPTCLPKP